MMPNQFHLRANIDRLWRRANGRQPSYIRLKALDAIVREIFAPNDRARANYQLYLATDPFDVARHKLRDLYDHAGSLCPLLPLGEGWGEGSLTPEEEEHPDENDDPL